MIPPSDVATAVRLLEDDKSARLAEEEFRPIIGCSFTVCTVEEAGGGGENARFQPFVVTARIGPSHDAKAGFAQNDASSSDAGDQSDGWQAKWRIKAIQRQQSFVSNVNVGFFVPVYFFSIVHAW